MGNGCCKQEIENNPDGSQKEPQTAEQAKEDPAELRRWAKEGDAVELEKLLKRMPVRAIRSGAKKSEGVPDEEGQTALHFAASRGSLACCELLVLYGAAANCRDAKGKTPLHVALEGGRRQVAHFLLEHGADVNMQDATGASPFLSVLLSGRKRLSSWLLQRCGTGAIDVGLCNLGGLGPVTVAARHGWWDLMEQLIGMAADTAMVLNTRSDEGETPLAWALKYGAAGLLTGPELSRVVSGLLDRGASATLPLFKEQIPPLCLAAATGDSSVLAALRARGAQLDPAVCKDAVSRTALHYAAAKGHGALCSLLQAEGAPVGLHAALLDDGGNTPLHLAAQRGHGDVARALLERCEAPAQAILTPNRDGVSVYHLFLKAGPDDQAEEGLLWMLRQLSAEEARTPIKVRDAVQATPLLLAVGSHQERVVAALLEAGHDPNEATADGVTPLSRCLAGATAATAASDGAIFRQLVERGARVEGASGSCHPLLAICMNPLSRFAESVIPILLKGAEQELGGETAASPWAGRVDSGGRGPLHLAALFDNAFMVRYLLEEAKMDVDAPSGEGLTPLMYAAWGCSTHAMRILLNRRADLRAVDPSGASVLSYCLRLDKPESLACGAMLLLMGAPPEDCVDGRGEGLLHRAVRYGCSEFIPLWARYGGNLCLLASTADEADDVPEELEAAGLVGLAGAAVGGRGGKGGKAEEDFLDTKPVAPEVDEDADDGAWDLASGRLEGVADDVAKAEKSSEAAPGKDANGSRDGDDGSRVGSRSGSQIGARAASRSESQVGSRIGSRVSSRTSRGSAAAADEGGVVALGEAPREPCLESFSVDSPARPSQKLGGTGGTSGQARAVAEAVEAAEAEAARYPSFCRRPSRLEVRRWARSGAAWFDDALPAGPAPELGPDYGHPSLPLPPGEEEEEAEEAALAEEEAPDTLPALDADALLRRMLLSRIKDRRGRGGAAAAASSGSGGAAEDEWMEDAVRSAENALAALSRGASAADAATTGGSGSRAVRAARIGGRRSGPGAAEAKLSPLPGPVAESLEGTDAGAFDIPGVPETTCGADAACTGTAATEGGLGGNMVSASGKMESAMADLKGTAMGLASLLVDKRVSINDPYFQEATRYTGVPRYMDEAMVRMTPSPTSELAALADSLAERLASYPTPTDELLLRGAELRERNMRWYNLGLSPSEYPLKAGQWRSAVRKAAQAAAAARLRRSVGPGGRVTVRSRKAWFGLPAMPSRPELRSTSALVYAVRLARPACVAALLAASLQPLNTPDGWGHTPVAYAAYMAARGDRQDARLAQVYDMLLARLPQVNFTRLDSEDGSAGHSLLCPINLAVITGDRARLAHLVMRCAGAINCSWTALLEIPIYLNGRWERQVARCDSRCPPLALAVLSKKIDMVKLVLDLGANPNAFGESRDVRLKAKLLREYEEEQARSKKLASAYEGVLSKTKLGLVQRLARLKRAIASIEIPGISRPHPFVTPLHLAARTGQPEMAFLLLRRGALPNGAGAVPYAKRSPLQEALMYARANYTVTDPFAKRTNWAEVRPTLDDIPPMGPEAAQKEAEQRQAALMRMYLDPVMMAIKAVAVAAKYAVNFLLEMRKRPIAHWDPALAAAHVLLAHRAPYDLAEPQTAIVLRDLMDNGTWPWLQRPGGERFSVVDPDWTSSASTAIETLKEDSDVGYRPISAAKLPQEYKRLKQQFVSKSDETYFGEGSKALHERYRACSDAYLAERQKYVYDVLHPAITGMAEQAVSSHASAATSLLAALAAARRAALEGSAAALAAGVVLSEERVMDPEPFEAFQLPATEPAPPGADGPAAAAQASSAEALRARAGRVAEEESWGRVMRWRPGGVYLGAPGEGDMETAPCGQAELKQLTQAVAGVDTDELKESLANLQESLTAGVETLLSKMQDAQEGLSQLLEVIGIDFLDLL